MPKRTFRQALDLRLRRILWPRLRRRALFLFGGIMIGIFAVLMTTLADRAQVLFFSVTGRWPYLPLVLTPAGFALVAWLTRRFFAGAQGSGIPQVMAARRLADPEARARLVSVKVAVGKIALLAVGLAVGASAGREGPTVQVGAATMFALGRLAPHRQPGLLLAGASAGVAAAFNAPLAGIMFGIEEMSRSFEVRSSVLVLATVIAAGLTSQAILGDYTYFGRTATFLAWGWGWLAVPVAGIVCGLAGGLFSRLVIACSRGLPGRPGQWIARWPVAFAALCGLAVALCGLIAGGSIFGTGYAQSKLILAGEAVPQAFGAMKLVATWISAISGIPGGIFSPSLAVGAGLAYNLSPLLPQVPVAALAILCMAAYLSGVVQAPLTSFIIVSEMTADHGLIFPMMLAALIGSAASRLICPHGVYHALAENFSKGQATSERRS
jgi:H+/Cl- antiporter ClcA